MESKAATKNISGTLAIMILASLILYSASNPVSAYAQEENSSLFETVTVTIPNGAASPTPDLTLQNVGNWYEPGSLTISAGDTVIWKNEDTEPHTVTSGQGAGIASAQTNEKGTPDGVFDSDFFAPAQSWSHTFYTPGPIATSA